MNYFKYTNFLLYKILLKKKFSFFPFFLLLFLTTDSLLVVLSFFFRGEREFFSFWFFFWLPAATAEAFFGSLLLPVLSPLVLLPCGGAILTAEQNFWLLCQTQMELYNHQTHRAHTQKPHTPKTTKKKKRNFRGRQIRNMGAVNTQLVSMPFWIFFFCRPSTQKRRKVLLLKYTWKNLAKRLSQREKREKRMLCLNL